MRGCVRSLIVIVRARDVVLRDVDVVFFLYLQNMLCAYRSDARPPPPPPPMVWPLKSHERVNIIMHCLCARTRRTRLRLIAMSLHVIDVHIYAGNTHARNAFTVGLRARCARARASARTHARSHAFVCYNCHARRVDEEIKRNRTGAMCLLWDRVDGGGFCDRALPRPLAATKIK